MKRMLVLVVAAATVAILIFGNINWSSKTTIDLNKANASETSNGGEKKNLAEEQRMKSLLSFAANWPEAALVRFEEALGNGEEFKILFLGSTALGEGDGSWPELVQQGLVNTYGKVFRFATLSYDVTSTTFVEEGLEEEIIAEEADLILFEPLTLKDNGKVVIETSWENTETVMDAVKAAKEDTVFILQPPHPLYNASWYRTQVESLEGFANDSSIPYLNHWEAWPETSDQALNDYLVSDRSAPNEEGHKRWAQYLLDYFIAS